MDGGLIDFSPSEKQKLRQIVSHANKYNTKVMVSLHQPTHNSPLFPHIGGTPAVRANFSRNIKNYIKENGLHGVDIDWEYPYKDTSKDYAELMKALHAELNPEGYVISSAVSAFSDLMPWVPVAAFPYVSFLNVMGYDFSDPGGPPGPQASFAQTTKAMKAWIRKGLPPQKAVFGVPFYGRTWNDGQGGRAIHYSEIWEKYHPAENVNQIKQCWFNGYDMMKKKSQFAVDNNYGGMMIWQYDQDTNDVEHSLLTAMNKVITPVH